MRELGFVLAGDAGSRPVILDSQPFGESTVIQVSALPPAALGKKLNAGGEYEKDQKREHEVLPGLEIGVQDEHQSHEDRENMCCT